MENIVNELIAGAGIVGLLIGAVGGLANARKNSVIKVLTQDNVATKEYNKTLEAEIATVKAERDNFKQQAETFREHAQGSPQLKALTEAVKNQTKVIADYFYKQPKQPAKRGTRGRTTTTKRASK